MANAEIERLRALLASQEIPTSGTETSSPNGLTSVLQAISQRLARDDSPNRSTKSAKIPDPPLLTDGKEPTFESWKLQIRGKLRVNSDHFPTDEARMTYIFGRTGGDAQKHLSPRYDEESEDPFSSDKEMIDYLASVYEDPYKIQNARLDYKSLTMRTTETFADFNTRFLHLAGQAKIPKEDLRPDLFDKLTLELQRTVLPIYSSLNTIKSLADECLSLDQGLRRLKARSDRIKARTALTTTPPTRKTTATASTTHNTPAHTGLALRESTPDRMRPSYADPAIQALSNQGACFSCGQKGHFSRDCPSKSQDKMVAIHQVYAGEVQAESGKGEP
jgi:hypothetical protein